MSPKPVGMSNASSRRMESAPCLRNRSTALTVGMGMLLGTCLFYKLVTESRTVQMIGPPYKPIPTVGRISPPTRKTKPPAYIGRTEAIDALSDICGLDTAKAYPPPWDKCKRDFVPPNITLVSPPAGKVQVGDTIHYRIDSNLAASSGCDPGGNFWHAALESDVGQPKASCAATIVDNCDGSYDMYALAAWPGNVTFKLILVNPGDAVRHLRRVVWPAEDRVPFIGYFKYREGGKKQIRKAHSTCYFRHGGNWTGLCPYPHPKAMGNMTLVCGKIDGMPCDSLDAIQSHAALVDKSVKILSANVSYLFTRPNKTEPLWKPSASLKIEGKDYDPGKLPRCRPDQPVPRFQGYWRNGKWHSLLCAMKRDWTQTEPLRECLKNKHWVLLGDSTTRQWYNSLRGLIGIKVSAPLNAIFGRNMILNYTTLNATVRFQMHFPRVGANPARISELMSEVDVLDSLVDPACSYVVVISPWAHFTQWTKKDYMDRTRLIREAVLRLRQRCPDVPVVLKGPHPWTHEAFSNHIYASDYIIKQIGVINREFLHGIGVWFLPLWDINLAHPVPNTIHMPNDVIREELKMFLSFICES